MRFSGLWTVTIAGAAAAQNASEPCARVSASLAAQPSASPYIGVFDAYDCLTSVPIATQGDLTLLHEVGIYSQWQTTLAYLKNPPTGYLQPPVDIVAKLDNITSALQSGAYTDEYLFQIDLALIIQSAYDGHYTWLPDIAAVLSFTRPDELILTSISMDGIALPKIYSALDVQAYAAGANFTPSAISQINGQDVEIYLASQASTGNCQDPDCLYNYLLYSQALASVSDVNQGGKFQTQLFFQGNTTTLEFANGTAASFENQASTSHNFSGVQSGEDFLNAFCMGPPPSDLATSSASVASHPVPTATGYPSPIAIAQMEGQLVGSGYLLAEDGLDDVAILSLPSFAPSDPSDLLQYSNVVATVIQSAIAIGRDKLILDMRGNPGGQPEIGIDIFRQLFPTIDPFLGTRMHAITALDQIGQFVAQDFDNTTDPTSSDLDDGYDSNINYRVDGSAATNRPWSSWSQLFGPNMIYGDNFTGLTRQNNSNPFAYSTNYTIYNYGYRTITNTTQPFAAENIVLLQDGVCGSACAIFSEMMKSQGKVRTVVVGGRPQYGPMQGVGGVKGGQQLGWDTINSYAQGVFDASTPAQLDSYAGTPLEAVRNATHFLSRAAYGADGATITSVNFENLYREGDTTQTPLQFVYEAADCRLWYTPDMVLNVTKTWAAVAKAQWGVNGTSMCVQNSSLGPGSLSSGNITVPGTPILTPAQAGGAGNANGTSFNDTNGGNGTISGSPPAAEVGNGGVGLLVPTIVSTLGCTVALGLVLAIG